MNGTVYAVCINIKPKEIELLKEENRQLKLQLEWLKKRLFGSTSERLDPSQIELFEQGDLMGKPEPPLDSDAQSEREEEKSKTKRKRRGKDELGLKNLPVVAKEVIIPQDVQDQPEAYKKIGERHHDELDYQPGRLQWQRSIIEEYQRIDDKLAAPIKEPAPVAPIPGAQITAALAAAVVIDKHCDHIPHYRQSQRIFREQSAIIDHKTINSWAIHTAKHLAPIATCIGRELLSTDLLQIDETTMRYLASKKGKAQTGYIWLMRNPSSGAVYYHWHKRRNTDALLELLGYDKITEDIAFQGIIQCDGYICYETLNSTYQSIKLGACMAHIRRKFLDDKSLRHIPWVSYLLRLIKVLYSIERRLRDKNAPPDEAKRMRMRFAKPLIDRLEILLREQQPNHRPSSSLGVAINYALVHWKQLKLYLDTGELPIDNNGVENAVRPCKLGLKNYMFFGSFEGGFYNTILYTLIENCKAVDINVRDYLEHAIEALHHTPASDLTPAKVAEAWRHSTAAA